MNPKLILKIFQTIYPKYQKKVIRRILKIVRYHKNNMNNKVRFRFSNIKTQTKNN